MAEDAKAIKKSSIRFQYNKALVRLPRHCDKLAQCSIDTPSAYGYIQPKSKEACCENSANYSG